MVEYGLALAVLAGIAGILAWALRVWLTVMRYGAEQAAAISGIYF